MEAQVDRSELASNTLDSLIAAWNERDADLPVAVVVSVFDDLLQYSPINGEDLARPLCLSDVTIDADGVARLRSGKSLGDVTQLTPMLARALGEGLHDDAVPMAAQPLLMRLASDDPTDLPMDAEQLRQWIRDALGTPALREEVLAYCAGAGVSVIEEASSLSEFPIEIASDFAEDEAETQLPTPASIEDEDEELEEFETQLPHPEEIEDPVVYRSTSNDPIGNRPVIRLKPEKNPVAVNVAPAARRSAQAGTTGGDSILMPAEPKKWFSWIMVVGMVVAVLYYVFGF